MDLCDVSVFAVQMLYTRVVQVECNEMKDTFSRKRRCIFIRFFEYFMISFFTNAGYERSIYITSIPFGHEILDKFLKMDFFENPKFSMDFYFHLNDNSMNRYFLTSKSICIKNHQGNCISNSIKYFFLVLE